VATCAIAATPTNVSAVNVLPIGEENQLDNSERSLVQRAQRGDEAAFATLFQLHKKRVYSVCLQMTKDVADAEDLTQEAFMQVFRSINSFRGDSAFSTWLYRVAVNTVLMKLRRRKSPPVLSLDEPVSSDSPSLKREVGKEDLNLSGAVDRIALRRAIELMPNQPSPHISLATILIQQGDPAGAAAERKKAADLSRIAVSRQRANFALDSGKALLKRGQIAEALVQLQSAVDADPNYAEAHSVLADALDRQGQSAAAALERQKAQKLIAPGASVDAAPVHP